MTGGIRGIYTAVLLKWIEQKAPGFLDRVHLFAGTSTGGILALGLAFGLTDVALRTSATPSYFPSYQDYIDGGVVANNPSMAALAQALDDKTGDHILEDVRLIPFGTGFFPEFIKGRRYNWGLAQWNRPLIALMPEGSMCVADYQCKQLLGDHYHGLSPPLKRPIGLDDAGKVGTFIRYANEVDIRPTLKWIKGQYF
ncbi:MAG: patatin-like phospholipase family protein [Anaerolineae bacterium]